MIKIELKLSENIEALGRKGGKKMSGEAKKNLKRLVCAGIILLAVLTGMKEARGRIEDLDGDGNVSFSDYAILATD